MSSYSAAGVQVTLTSDRSSRSGDRKPYCSTESPRSAPHTHAKPRKAPGMPELWSSDVLTRRETTRVRPGTAIAARAAPQHGVVSRQQLVVDGVTPSMIRTRIADGALVLLHPGVYAVGHRQLRIEGHWLAAVLAVGPGTALS